MGALRALDSTLSGYQVTRLEHSLQTAARAEADGADDEMIVGALIHDLGDDMAPENHSRYAATIIQPYVREEVTWVVKHHGLFQTYFYAHHYGEDPNARDVCIGITRSTMPLCASVATGIRRPSIPTIRPRRWRISRIESIPSFRANPGPQ